MNPFICKGFLKMVWVYEVLSAESAAGVLPCLVGISVENYSIFDPQITANLETLIAPQGGNWNRIKWLENNQISRLVSISAQKSPLGFFRTGLCFLEVASEFHGFMKDSENMDVAIFRALEEDQMLGRMDSAWFFSQGNVITENPVSVGQFSDQRLFFSYAPNRFLNQGKIVVSRFCSVNLKGVIRDCLKVFSGWGGKKGFRHPPEY